MQKRLEIILSSKEVLDVFKDHPKYGPQMEAFKKALEDAPTEADFEICVKIPGVGICNARSLSLVIKHPDRQVDDQLNEIRQQQWAHMCKEMPPSPVDLPPVSGELLVYTNKKDD